MRLSDEDFRKLYDEHHRHVYALALRLSDGVAEAEDLTQESFVAAWRSLATFRGESSVGTWLHAIVVRTAFSTRRRASRRGRLFGITDWPLVEAVQAHHDIRLDLERAIRTLPRAARAVLVLHEVFGYSHGDIATMLRVQPETSRSQLNRARRLLMKRLG